MAAAGAEKGVAGEKVKYFGVSDVISVAPPGPADEKRTAELMTFLEQNKRFESRADKQHRETVLATLGGILTTWVRNVSLALDPPIVDPASHRAHLFSFGSYRLGVNARDADIDTVCVLPAHIDHLRDFFGLSAEGSDEPSETGNQWRNSDQLGCILQETIEKHPQTENLVAVSSAYTPILTFDFMGVEIDVACGVVAHKTLPAVRSPPRRATPSRRLGPAARPLRVGNPAPSPHASACALSGSAAPKPLALQFPTALTPNCRLPAQRPARSIAVNVNHRGQVLAGRARNYRAKLERNPCCGLHSAPCASARAVQARSTSDKNVVQEPRLILQQTGLFWRSPTRNFNRSDLPALSPCCSVNYCRQIFQGVANLD
eukprot:COSAG02_NODE_1924_length_10351_cov_4.487320_7_plen_374_part_00